MASHPSVWALGGRQSIVERALASTSDSISTFWSLFLNATAFEGEGRRRAESVTRSGQLKSIFTRPGQGQTGADGGRGSLLRESRSFAADRRARGGVPHDPDGGGGELR